MLGAAVDAEITIPPVVFLLETELFHTAVEEVETLFSLTAADEFADAGDQKVHRRDGLAVVIHAHIERLDVLRVVGEEDGALEMLLGEVSLVLGLEVASPVDGIVEFLAAVLQYLDGLGVFDLFEFQVEHLIQAVQKVLVHEFIQEFDVLRAALKGVAHGEFQKILDERHIVVKVCEGDLRLDHPEFRRVT